MRAVNTIGLSAVLGLAVLAAPAVGDHVHEDVIVGRTAARQLAVEYDFAEDIVLPPVNGVLVGWAGDDPGFARVFARHFNRGFNGFGSTITQESAIQPFWRDSGQLLQETGSCFVVQRAVACNEGLSLFLDRLHDSGMTVSDDTDPIRTHAVDERFAVDIPENGAASLHGYYRPFGIGGRHMPRLYIYYLNLIHC